MTKARLSVFTAEPLSKEVRLALERLTRVDDVACVAAMPDVHLARAVCVGAVVATRNTLLPDAVGGDIGCGMSAMRLEGGVEGLACAADAQRLLERLAAVVPTTRHRSRGALLPEALTTEPLSSPALSSKRDRIGRVQFATLGRGNHFIELQNDTEGDLWIMVHSGSRGMGQAIRTHHAGGGELLRSIDAESAQGAAYRSDLDWALEYARASRRQMAEAAASVLELSLGAQADWNSYFDCHHNFVRRERHGDEELWVHRKGAISAQEGEPGIIPGSMGTASFHVSGRGYTGALASSSHGAGRVLSRTEARRQISAVAFSRQMNGIWFDDRLVSRLRDEAPAAYKDIGAVMRAQRKLTRVVRRLRPVLVYKGT